MIAIEILRNRAGNRQRDIEELTAHSDKLTAQAQKLLDQAALLKANVAEWKDELREVDAAIGILTAADNKRVA